MYIRNLLSLTCLLYTSQLPYDDLIHTMTDVLTKEHPDMKFHNGTLTYEYLVANYQLNDTMMEESLRLTLESAGRKVDSLSAGITFSSSDLGLSSVFLTMYLNLNGIRISLGDGIRMEHKGEEASMENFQKKCKELGRVLQENEERIEELGLMKVTDVPGVVKAVAVSYTHLDVYKRQGTYLTVPDGC